MPDDIYYCDLWCRCKSTFPPTRFDISMLVIRNYIDREHPFVVFYICTYCIYVYSHLYTFVGRRPGIYNFSAKYMYITHITSSNTPRFYLYLGDACEHLVFTLEKTAVDGNLMSSFNRICDLTRHLPEFEARSYLRYICLAISLLVSGQ